MDGPLSKAAILPMRGVKSKRCEGLQANRALKLRELPARFFEVLSNPLASP